MQRRTSRIAAGILVTVSWFSGLVVPIRAQQQQPPEDPEDDKRLGLWLDQAVSAGGSADKSLEIELHERFDEGASNLYEHFVQGGVAFRLKPWLTMLPSYRYQRFPGNPTVAYENRLLLNLTVNTSVGAWRPILRTFVEERFPRIESRRLDFGFVQASSIRCRYSSPGVPCWS